MANYRVGDLLCPDLADDDHANVWWQVPDFCFRPDQWSHAFLRGLKKSALGSDVCWEVGVGCGLNILLLREWFPQARFVYSDYNPKCTEISDDNLRKVMDLDAYKLLALHGQWDLLADVEGKLEPPRVDTIIGCLPQVPAPAGVNLMQGDRLAHYYDSSRYCSELNAFGLGLNHNLLSQARGVLRPQGRAILNLGGRPGLEWLLNMFASCDFAPRVIHEEVIAQERTTSIEPLASMEGESLGDFEFFEDELGLGRVNARQAHELRQEGREVFHKIYVIEGTMT